MQGKPKPLTMSIAEAARLLGISRHSAYSAAKRGELPVLRMGSRLLVPRAALMRLLEMAGDRTDERKADGRPPAQRRAG